MTDCARLIIVESTDAMLVPTFRFSVGAAEPVTTTSLRFTALTRSVKSSRAEAPAVTVTGKLVGEKPMRRTPMIRGPEGTPTITYSPFVPLVAPTRVPVTVTCASASPLPFAASVTLPRTVPVPACAARMAGGAKSAIASAAALRRTC